MLLPVTEVVVDGAVAFAGAVVAGAGEGEAIGAGGEVATSGCSGGTIMIADAISPSPRPCPWFFRRPSPVLGPVETEDPIGLTNTDGLLSVAIPGSCRGGESGRPSWGELLFAVPGECDEFKGLEGSCLGWDPSKGSGRGLSETKLRTASSSSARRGSSSDWCRGVAVDRVKGSGSEEPPGCWLWDWDCVCWGWDSGALWAGLVGRSQVVVLLAVLKEAWEDWEASPWAAVGPWRDPNASNGVLASK